jgi:inorganic triphosphatase YgiF
VHLERELKFRVEAHALARAARLLPFAVNAKRARLHSVYYDTADLRLKRAGAALRLRRYGRHWLQALKLPQSAQGALNARAEWEMPAPQGRLDCSLFPREAVRSASGLDLVRLARRLRPVFATRFERRSAVLSLGDGVRAEACIDRGAIEAGAKREPILELELELLEGEIGPLIGFAQSLVEPLGLRIESASKSERGYRLCQSAGPPPPVKWLRPPAAEHAAASDAFVALCGAALAQIAANGAGVAQGGDPEYLHQLRVGVRRLRSALHAFKRLLRRAQAREVERPLKQMMRTWGKARDWDVFCETLADAGSAPLLLGRARQKRAAARREARAIADSPAFQEAQLRVLRWLHRDVWKSEAARAESLARLAGQTLARLHAGLMQRARKIDWRDERRRHEVRIRVKRLRYACDFFWGCFPHQAMLPFIGRLESLQDTLGELNDVAVARRLLGEVASGNEASRLMRWLASRERELIASLEPVWRALRAKRPFWQPKSARRVAR